jgi:hypothetical protein
MSSGVASSFNLQIREKANSFGADRKNYRAGLVFLKDLAVHNPRSSLKRCQ